MLYDKFQLYLNKFLVELERYTCWVIAWGHVQPLYPKKDLLPTVDVLLSCLSSSLIFNSGRIIFFLHKTF